MSNYSGALEDANKVLLHLREPYNPGALIVKGDALYHMGMFEHSLVSYYRAARQPDLLSKFVHLSYLRKKNGNSPIVVLQLKGSA